MNENNHNETFDIGHELNLESNNSQVLLNSAKYEPVFYLKINRNTDDSLKCFWHWVEIVRELGTDFYVVCDKDEISNQLIDMYSNNGYSAHLKIIPSYWQQAEEILDGAIKPEPKWINCGTALLTPFLHANENGFENFWNIDADDSMLLCSAEICAKALKQTSAYADENNIDCLGLDFYYSTHIRFHEHWSFGVVYTKTTVDYIEAIKTGKKLVPQWIDKDWWWLGNIDELFNNLGYESLVKVVPFYIENMGFIHYNSGSHFWRANTVHFLHLHNGFIHYWRLNKNDIRNGIPIPEKCIQIDAGISDKESWEWAEKNQINVFTRFKQREFSLNKKEELP